MSSPDRPAAIELLEDAVISGIAAGEVVERPASIVKELVENSLDAGATRIDVECEEGPAGRLVVTDDGCGIERNQVELAVTRHATSKIRSLEDLLHIGSFGFRGEALASIAAVSDLELVTRTAGEEGGSFIRVRAGRVVESGTRAARPGSRVVVSDLFANVPARRKFLKSATAEYSLVADGVRRFALANPGVHLRLVRAGKTAADFASVAGLPARLRQVLGRELGASMVELDASYAGLRLRGAISPAGVSFGSARRMTFFVNERWVQDRLVFRSTLEAYRTYLLKGRYPAVVLSLELDPALVDVNVHPAKLELRFSDPALVQRFVVESVRDTLRGAASPLGRWGLTERDLLRATPRGTHRSTGAPGTRATDDAPGRSPGSQRGAEGGGLAASGDRSAAAREPMPERPAAERGARQDAIGAGHGHDGQPDLPGYSPSASATVTDDAVEETAPLPFVQAAAAEGAGTADLEVVGQVFAGYIVCQTGEELVLVDQHAAHERVLFERLMDAYRQRAIASQPLLVATTVEVGALGVQAIERFSDELATLGWDVAAFGDDDVVVRSVPAIAAGRDVAALVERLAADLLRTEADSAGTRLAEEVLATVACHAAVRVGKRLDAQAARALLQEVGTVSFSASCPHGRPVARTLSRRQVERIFGR